MKCKKQETCARLSGAPAVCILETEEIPLPRMQKKQTRSDGHICASGYVHKQELSRRAGQAEPIFCLGFGPQLCQITDVAGDPSTDIRNGGQSIGPFTSVAGIR